MNNFLDELRRRNVIRVAGVYAVVSWLLMQVATTLEESLGLPGWFDAVVVATLLLGLPIAVIFAWAFELTPEGLKREKDVDRSESITDQTGRKLDYAIVAGLVLLGVFLMWQQVNDEPADSSDTAAGASDETAGARIAGEDRGRGPAPTGDASSAVASNTIAVLPFDDLSPEGDQEYFSDGIAEEILNVLVRVQSLDVTSRTSSFQFKGRDLGIPEIALELGVRHILEGSVRKAGDAVRVTAQLIDTETDSHLWSNSYDRPLSAENIFVIQDEIAKSIVDALGETMGLVSAGEVSAPTLTNNLSAYELYLQARPLFQARLQLDVADELLARAIELDPEFAAAYAIRAALVGLMVSYGYSDRPGAEQDVLIEQYSSRALELDPTQEVALAAIGNRMYNAINDGDGGYDVSELLDLFDRAYDINPRSPSTLNWRGLTYSMIGNLDAALADFAACVDIDPFYLPCRENHFTTYGAMGDDETAISIYVDSLNTGNAKIHYAPFAALARQGEELAFKSATNSNQLLFGWPHHDELYLAFQNLEQDHIALAESAVAFRSDGGTYWRETIAPLVLPLGYTGIATIGMLAWDRSHKKYRQSEFFRNMILENEVLEYWHEHGFPDLCRPVGDHDFECD